MIDLFVGTFHGDENQVEVLPWEGELVNNSYNKIYSVKCYKCAKDPELFGSAIYKSNKGNLNLGQLPCGCGKAPRWTEEQQAVRVKRKCLERGYTFYGFESLKVTTATKLCLGCKSCGNVWSTCTINNFINHERGNGCPVCASSGFKQNKTGYLYVLKIENAQYGFTGYGISNVIAHRLSRHRSKLKESGFAITESTIFEMSGFKAMIIEDLLRMHFEITPQNLDGFKTEATHLHSYKDVLDFVIKTQQTLN